MPKQKITKEMVIYNMGIGTILAAATPGIPEEEISERLENAYRAFLAQALERPEKGS